MQTDSVLDNLGFASIARRAIPNIPAGVGAEDLEQEARIFAYQLQMSMPDKSMGYYANACIFHLRDWMRKEKRRLDPKAATERYLLVRMDWNQFSESQRVLVYQEIQKSDKETRTVLNSFLDGTDQSVIAVEIQMSQSHVSDVIQRFVKFTKVRLGR
jgi:hypothetical protein